MSSKRERLKQQVRQEVISELREQITKEIESAIREDERTKWKGEGESLVIYQVSGDGTKVTPRFEISEETTAALVARGYLPKEFADDETTIKLAFIMLTNEVTDQILEETNDNANDTFA